MKIENYGTRDGKTLRLCRGNRTESRPPTHARTSLSLVSLPARNTAARAYWRGVRAAEMAAWELTGGDYLLACAAKGEAKG